MYELQDVKSKVKKNAATLLTNVLRCYVVNRNI